MIFPHGSQRNPCRARGRHSNRFLSLKVGSRSVNRMRHTHKVEAEPPSLPIEPFNLPTALSGVPLSRLPDIKNRVEYFEPLDEETDGATMADFDDRNRTAIRFQETVSVVEIPHYNDYDKDTRRKLWSSKGELTVNRKRNFIEFLHETYYSPKYRTRSWWMCCEEERMIVHKGELLHPHTFFVITGKEPLFLWYSRLRAKIFIAKREQKRKQQRMAFRMEASWLSKSN